MGYGIFRVEKCKRQGATAMLAHALRQTAKPVPNAIPDAPPPEVLEGEATVKGARLVLDDLIGKAVALGQRWRKDAVEALDIFVGGSQESLLALSKSEQDSYFRDALTFIKSRWPGAVVLTAAVHRDESTPHMQVILAARSENGSFQGNAMVGNKGKLHDLQNEYFANVSDKYGLERGEIGLEERPKHVPVRTYYAFANANPELVESLRLDDVPPAPKETWPTKLNGEYKRLVAEREAIIAANNAKRAKIMDLASSAKRLHPAAKAATSERLREANRLAAVMKKDKAEVDLKLKDARKTLQDATETIQANTTVLRDIKNATNEMQLQAQAADGTWTKSGASMIDKWSKTMAPEMRDRLAKSLGIALKPGQGIIDQMRAAGRGRTLIECAQLADKHLGGILAPHVNSGGAQRDIDRHRG